MDIQDLFNDLRFWHALTSERIFICCYDGLEIWLEKFDYDHTKVLCTINEVKRIESYDDMFHRIKMHGGIDIKRSIDILFRKMHPVLSNMTPSIKSLICEF